MKLLFEFDKDKNKITFFGNGFEISSHAETYEDMAKFAKCVMEIELGIPNPKHRENNEERNKQKTERDFLDYLEIFVFLASLMQKRKKYYIKKTMKPYDGQIVLNCGVVTDKDGNELVFI